MNNIQQILAKVKPLNEKSLFLMVESLKFSECDYQTSLRTLLAGVRQYIQLHYIYQFRMQLEGRRYKKPDYFVQINDLQKWLLELKPTTLTLNLAEKILEREYVETFIKLYPDEPPADLGLLGLSVTTEAKKFCLLKTEEWKAKWGENAPKIEPYSYMDFAIRIENILIQTLGYKDEIVIADLRNRSPILFLELLSSEDIYILRKNFKLL